MTTAEVVAGLRAAARKADDLALSEAAGARYHRPEYERCLATRESHSGATPQQVDAEMRVAHERALELYDLVINSERRAADLHAEAALFEAAADLIALQIERDAL